jgi:hypothetical protein
MMKMMKKKKMMMMMMRRRRRRIIPELRNWRKDLTTRRVRGESVLKLSIAISTSCLLPFLVLSCLVLSCIVLYQIVLFCNFVFFHQLPSHSIGYNNQKSACRYYCSPGNRAKQAVLKPIHLHLHFDSFLMFCSVLSSLLSLSSRATSSSTSHRIIPSAKRPLSSPRNHAKQEEYHFVFQIRRQT